MANKTFLSCVDSVMDLDRADIVTQPIMHLVIANYAESIGGSITFYTGEDPLTRASQALMRSMLAKDLPIDGVVFYRLKQFMYGEQFDFAFLSEILMRGYEAHFARERLAFCNVSDLDAGFRDLYCYEAISLGNAARLQELVQQQ